MRRARWLAALVAVSLGLGSSLAFAEPTAADKATARRLFAEGRKKRSAGDLRGALGAFQAADAIMEVPTTSVDLGCTQLDLGLFVEGQESLTRAVRWKGSGRVPRAYSEAQAEAKRLLTELAAHIPTLRIEARVPPAAVEVAEVDVDGHGVPLAALAEPYAVNPGSHVVGLSIAKVPVKQVRVEVKDASTTPVLLDASNYVYKLEEPPPIATEPERPVREPLSPMPRVEPERPRAGWVKPVLVTGLAVAAAGLATGAVAGGISLAKTAEASSVCPDRRCPIDQSQVLTTATTAATVADVGFLVAGAGAAMVAVAWLWPRTAPGEGRVAVTPAVSPRGAFLSGAVSF